jgi:uncharacterized protein
MKIGVLSDTHDYFDSRLPGLFDGVDHILHAGDIGRPWIILELEQIAPVTAIIGNTDDGLPFRDTAIVTLAQRTFLLHHIVHPDKLNKQVRDLIIRNNPDVVIFGHTHQRSHETRDGTLYLNPGYAGVPRPNLERSVAILDCDDSGFTVDFIDLESPSP